MNITSPSCSNPFLLSPLLTSPVPSEISAIPHDYWDQVDKKYPKDILALQAALSPEVLNTLLSESELSELGIQVNKQSVPACRAANQNIFMLSPHHSPGVDALSALAVIIYKRLESLDRQQQQTLSTGATTQTQDSFQERLSRALDRFEANSAKKQESNRLDALAVTIYKRLESLDRQRQQTVSRSAPAQTQASFQERLSRALDRFETDRVKKKRVKD